MNNLYEALEICLQELEQGADIETVLFRYPDLADELRPILEGSINARSMAIVAPSSDVVRRNRARVLQHAAQMREAKVKSSQRIWFVSIRRIAVTLAVVTALFVSGTGLVRAASTTLPGDNLYPVKRTWEDVLLLFTFNLQQRDALELEHENERLQELIEVFAEGRSAEVEFSGIVTSQTGSEWIVNGVQVMVSPQTEIRDGSIVAGSAVRVKGRTQGDGIVLAERIRLLSSEDKLPEIEYEHEGEEHDNEGPNQQEQDHSGPGAGSESPKVEETRTSEVESKPREESFDGVVVSMDNNVLIVSGITIDTRTAEEIKGTPAVGVAVKVEGYYDSNGVFIVTKIEFKNEESGSGSGDENSAQDSNSNADGDNSIDNNIDNGNDNNGSDDNGDDSGGNDNSSDDNSNSDNGNDSGGGGDNSGSGGGGGD